jgi:hypothetical protein
VGYLFGDGSDRHRSVPQVMRIIPAIVMGAAVLVSGFSVGLF